MVLFCYVLFFWVFFCIFTKVERVTWCGADRGHSPNSSGKPTKIKTLILHYNTIITIMILSDNKNRVHYDFLIFYILDRKTPIYMFYSYMYTFFGTNIHI